MTHVPGDPPQAPDDLFDDLAGELQAHIDDDALRYYGPEAFRRWKALPPMGRLAGAHGMGRVTGTCGDTIEISLCVDAERIIDAAFFSDGCGSSQVCASVAVELALGKSLDAAYDIAEADILALLPGFPENERHCAHLAAKALGAALHEIMRHGRS